MNTVPPVVPVTEAELQAYVDGQMPPTRQREVEAWLQLHPEASRRVADDRAHRQALRTLFDPVLREALPSRLRRAAKPPLPWYAQRLAAAVLLAVVGGVVGWSLRGTLAGAEGPALAARQAPAAVAAAAQEAGFAQRAAVAHAVFSPDARRPVEVDAAHEDQLVAWLSRRMGAPMKPPHLQALGYALEGGRLLPGGQGPVAQFMYRDAEGARLTLYVSDEIGETGAGGHRDVAFRFARQGNVNTFYWVDGPFGYALCADADRSALARVSAEVYRQLAAPAPGPAR